MEHIKEPVHKESFIAGATDEVVSRLHVLWLFTRSDLKTVVFPQLAFSLMNVLSGKIVPKAPTFTLAELLLRSFWATGWLWLHLLILDISNQRQSDSIVEDSTNKPWRPLPSRRISPEAARRLLFVAAPSAILLSWKSGVLLPSMTLMTLSWLYNDIGGANEHFLMRNLLNAGGLVSFGAGATFIISGTTASELYLSRTGRQWFEIIGAVIATTIHVQDLADVEGDALRNRHTLPLRWGQQVARYSAAILVMFWSLACPAYWGLEFTNYATSFCFGLGLALLTLRGKSIRSDEIAWKLWCLWMMVLFTLPLKSM